MSSSSEAAYEDDFEHSVKEPNPKPDPKPIQTVNSPKATPTKPLSKPPRKELSPKLSEIAKLANYRPNEIFDRQVQPGKKSVQNLEKENFLLRNELKLLNERISMMLESDYGKTVKSSKNVKTEQKGLKEENEKEETGDKFNLKTGKGGNLLKKVLAYELEYLRLKQIYSKFNDVDCLINLRNDIRQKKNRIESLEKELKGFMFSINSKDREINNFDMVELPEDKMNHKQLMAENMKLIEQIESLEQTLQITIEKQEKTSSIEDNLKEKYEKLSALASNYIVEIGDIKSKDLYKSSKKTLENILKVTQVSLTQLRIKEHDLKNEDKRLDQELKKYQLLLKEKDDVLIQVRTELDSAIHLASTSKLDQLATLLKSNSRSLSTLRSLSPKAGTTFGMKSDSSLKGLHKVKLLNSCNYKESEKAESREEKFKENGDKRSEKLLNDNHETHEVQKNDKTKPVDQGVFVFEDKKTVTEHIVQETPTSKEIKLIDDLNQIEEDLNNSVNLLKELSKPKTPKLFDELDSKPKPKTPTLFDELDSKPKAKRGFLEELENSIKKNDFFIEDKNNEEIKESKKKDKSESSESISDEKVFVKKEIKLEENFDFDFKPKVTHGLVNAEEFNKEIQVEANFDFDFKSKVASDPAKAGEFKSDFDLFASIPVSKPKEKRNRDHLFQTEL